jgi:hypothetical protein
VTNISDATFLLEQAGYGKNSADYAKAYFEDLNNQPASTPPTKSPASTNNGQSSLPLIYMGGNTLSIKGPDGKAYNFSAGNLDTTALQRAITNANVSGEQKQAMLNQLEAYENQFAESLKNKK